MSENVGTSFVDRVREMAEEPVPPITDEQIGRYVRAVIEACHSVDPRYPEWETRIVEQVAEWMRR